jgi:hypothetical protein
MIVKDVVVLQEAGDDLAAGRTFYDQMESGVGDYFWDSLIADIESLSIFAGIHTRKYGLYSICYRGPTPCSIVEKYPRLIIF